MRVDVLLDLLENIDQVKFIRNMHENGIHVAVYEGGRGNPVLIETTDEEIDYLTIKNHFDDLGVDSFFYDFITPD